MTFIVFLYLFTVEVPPETPPTGDTVKLTGAYAAGAIGVAGLLGAIFSRKRRKNK